MFTGIWENRLVIEHAEGEGLCAEEPICGELGTLLLTPS